MIITILHPEILQDISLSDQLWIESLLYETTSSWVYRLLDRWRWKWLAKRLKIEIELEVPKMMKYLALTWSTQVPVTIRVYKNTKLLGEKKNTLFG